MDLQKICDDVEREWQMGGLSDGLYGDYAKEVARRAVDAEREACVKACEAAEDTGDDRGIERDVAMWNKAVAYWVRRLKERSNIQIEARPAFGPSRSNAGLGLRPGKEMNMSETNNGGPAFPNSGHSYTFSGGGGAPSEGMSLRDYFAAKAMQSIVACEDTDFDTYELRAQFAYRQADEMLKAREKQS